MSNNLSLIHQLYKIEAIQFGDFIFKSGIKSSIYINLRKIISYPPLLRQIAESMWQKINVAHFDMLCGVPYTALPIATCLSLDHQLPMVMRRKEKKDYGTKQMIEGVFQPGQRCLIIEDVITTGGSILETAADLESAGLQVTQLIALVDREQGGRKNLEQHYPLATVLTLSEMLKTLLQTNFVPVEQKKIIETYLRENYSNVLAH